MIRSVEPVRNENATSGGPGGVGLIGLGCRITSSYTLDMRILVTGDRHWRCDELAERVVNRLLARYGPDLVIIHGGAPGVDQSFSGRAGSWVSRSSPTLPTGRAWATSRGRHVTVRWSSQGLICALHFIARSKRARELRTASGKPSPRAFPFTWSRVKRVSRGEFRPTIRG